MRRMNPILRSTHYSSASISLQLSVSFNIFLYTAFSTQCFTLAQTPSTFYSPAAVSYPAFARTVTKLYIIGGMMPLGSDYDKIPQFMSLDLSIPWNTTLPAWTKLADGPRQSLFPAAFSSDEQILYAFHIRGTTSPWQYHVQDDTWQEMTAPLFENTETQGVKAVTDPRTGLIYLAAGSDNSNNHPSPLKQLDIYDPVSQTIHSIGLLDPAKPFPVRLKYGSVWSKYRNSILYWGGRYNISDPPGDIAENVITELSTDSWTWSIMPTKGPAPEVRSFHCMAGNEDGTKVVSYGGQLRNDTLLGEVWILDVPTTTWSQGPSGPIRASAACAIAGDLFIIWGGRRGAIVNALPEMMIYNISSSTYITEYQPPAFYKDLRPPPPLTRTKAPWPTDGTNDPKGLTIGCVVGGLVLVGAIAGIIITARRRRQRHRLTQTHRRPESLINRASNRLTQLLMPGRRRGRGPEEGGCGGSLKKDPQLTIEDLKLQQTLRELEEEEKELEEQQKEIDQKRQLLVLQRKESSSSSSSRPKRGPIAFVADEAEIISLPTSLLQLSPVTLYSVAYSPESLNDRRTVQAGPMGVYQSDSYADAGPRKESDLGQDVIEPIYEPSPRVNNAIPDLVRNARYASVQQCLHPPPAFGKDLQSLPAATCPHKDCSTVGNGALTNPAKDNMESN
ncbi:hypothetical protein BGZ95_011496 [Linnemannia exigua]|uniref:Galactose oxidase n=1 Tax=Linnemannia exigua TaxID=604196 RepID=A0AAD4H474_9FUNG|nr:hypothetical protein BGZ95_011496 [Linnemannia exigua]